MGPQALKIGVETYLGEPIDIFFGFNWHKLGGFLGSCFDQDFLHARDKCRKLSLASKKQHTKKHLFRERKWRFNGKKEKTWRGSKSAFLPLSLHFLILSLSCLLFISSQFSHSIAIFSEAASQLPSTCASHSGMLFFNEIFQNRSIFQKFLNRRKKVLKNTVFLEPFPYQKVLNASCR